VADDVPEPSKVANSPWFPVIVPDVVCVPSIVVNVCLFAAPPAKHIRFKAPRCSTEVAEGVSCLEAGSTAATDCGASGGDLILTVEGTAGAGGISPGDQTWDDKEVPMRRITDNFLPVVTALASGIMLAALAMI
jgi:hypothetical protein